MVQLLIIGIVLSSFLFGFFIGRAKRLIVYMQGPQEPNALSCLAGLIGEAGKGAAETTQKG